MKEIKVLDGFPVILTKDKEWLKNGVISMKPGEICLLPEDAVLVLPPLRILETIQKFADAVIP